MPPVIPWAPGLRSRRPRSSGLYIFDGTRSVWSAPAGTGTGFRLETEEHQ